MAELLHAKKSLIVRLLTMLACGAIAALVANVLVNSSYIGDLRFVHGDVFRGVVIGLMALLAAGISQAFFAGSSEAAEAYDEMVHHDMATNLLSRDGFARELANFTDPEREGGAIINAWLVAFEFDSIKDINEVYGHEIGDTVIRILGDRLRRIVGNLGPVGRIGGSEYVIAINAANTEREIKAAVDALIDSMSQPIKLGALSMAIFGNAGVVRLARHTTRLEPALRCATLARAAARDAGRGTWAVYHPEMSQIASYRKWLESELSSALQRSEFTLHYQPQVDHPSGRITGYEALLRWTHHEKGTIAPTEFISIAEHCGLIRQIGTWVLRKACEDALHMPDDVNISVNVSTVQIMDSDFIKTVARILRETGIAPHRVELEVTESIVITDFKVVRKRFADIRALGCTIAIDDFGTGYSNLTNLAELPFQKLKIDKSFVDRMDRQKNIGSIIGTIVNLAHSLDATVIAEGVENELQATILQAAGCQIMQGYFYGRPLPLTNVLENGAQIQPVNTSLHAVQAGSGHALSVHDATENDEIALEAGSGAKKDDDAAKADAEAEVSEKQAEKPVEKAKRPMATGRLATA